LKHAHSEATNGDNDDEDVGLLSFILLLGPRNVGKKQEGTPNYIRTSL
jgi:hypothetical protein